MNFWLDRVVLRPPWGCSNRSICLAELAATSAEGVHAWCQLLPLTTNQGSRYCNDIMAITDLQRQLSYSVHRGIHIGDIMFFLKVLILIYLIYFHIQIYCNFQNYHSDLSYSSSVSIGDISNCLSCCGGVSAPVLCCISSDFGIWFEVATIYGIICRLLHMIIYRSGIWSYVQIIYGFVHMIICHKSYTVESNHIRSKSYVANHIRTNHIW